MIGKVIVTNRILVLNLCIGVDVRRYIGIDRPFILISCFGNKETYIDYNPNLELLPHVLLKNEQYINSIKKFGMVDHVNVFCDDTTPDRMNMYNDWDGDWKSKYIVKFFDEENAKDILEFMNKYVNEDVDLVVHCDAGISRSSAVALSCCNKFNLTKEYIHKSIDPNPLILDVCKKVFDYE